MKVQKATRKMMLLASEDNPYYPYKGSSPSFNYEMYARCYIQNGILKLSLFMPDYIRAGSRTAAFEVYCDREIKQFITYDCVDKKWRSAKLDRLLWLQRYCLPYDAWMKKSESKAIKDYFGGDRDGCRGVLDFQRKIRDDELERRHRKETDPWDADLMQIPPLPKDWKRWVSKVGVQDNYIYYNYVKKGAVTGYCTFCDKEVPIKNPRHNKEGRCGTCRHEITFKAVGRAGYVATRRNYMYLIQRCRDGFAVREFYGSRYYKKGEYKQPELRCYEERRIIYDKTARNPRAYYYGLYKNRSYRWIKAGLCGAGWIGATDGRVYGKTLTSLNTHELKHTGLVEAIKLIGNTDPEKFLAVRERVPLLEKLVKAGLKRLASECVYGYYDFQNRLHDDTATSLTKALGINTSELKRLRRNDGGKQFWAWLKYEKATNKPIPDYVITWFCAENITSEDLRFILNRMNPVQIHNYVKRQMRQHRASSKTVLGKWADYLSMAKRLKLDTNDEIIYRVNRLYLRHDELVKRCHSKSLALQAGEILEKYPHVEDVLESMKDKYEYSGDEYTIVAPSVIEDVLLEGIALSHCVASSERYWERIERQEAYVLFLRKTSDADKPYYTLEVEPNGTVRQMRTEYDRQGEDIDDVRKFLSSWQRILAERLTPKDNELSNESRILRDLEFTQLRDDRVIIRNGDLAGQLLIDVLTADLIELAA